MSDLQTGDIVQLLVLGLVGLYLSGAVVRLFRGRLLTATLTLTFWVVAFGAVLTAYSYREELSGVADRVIATVVPGTPLVTDRSEVTILRAPDGQFAVKALAGKARVDFVFDTGASAVVLRAEDAARLGLNPRALRYTVPVGTANGRTLAAEAVLPELSVGPVRERDVPVLVARPGALHTNLLGMTFLDRLGSYAVERDRLVMRGR